MAISRSLAQERALEVVKAALNSGSIKLQGSNSGGYNEKYCEADAQYLSTLINALSTSLREHTEKD